MRTRARASLLAMAALVTAQAASAVTITRGPYLNTPTQNGITLRWRTDIDGKLVDLDDDPDASSWRRFEATIYSVLPMDDLL